MKPSGHLPQILQWTSIAVVVATVTATGIFTNITIRSIEKNLPIVLLTELEAIGLLLDDLANVVSAAEATRMTPGPENHDQLKHQISILLDGLVKLRDTHVSGNRIQASAFHAVVAPAISDIQLWLSEGVSGHGPETAETLNAVQSRITTAYSKARALSRDSRSVALSILNDQRIQLGYFLISVNLLFLLVLAITVFIFVLITRRQVSLRRELEAQNELRRTEKTLKETEEFYSKLIAAIPDIVIRTDINGRILFLNDVAIQIGGYQQDEIIGKNFLEFIAPEDRETAAENLRLMFDSSLGPKGYAFISKTGEKIPFEVNSDVLRRQDGSAYGTVSICRDISKRMQAENALRESEKQYRLLVENANDAIFIAQDGMIKFPNPRALEILGFTQEQPEAIPFADFIHPKDRERVLDIHRRRMSGERNLSTNYSFRIINKAGREYSVQLNSVLLNWEGRHASLNFVRDITDQLNLEASLRQAQKMEAIGTLAGGIAHDFNNLLMGIQGRISLMMFEMEASHPFFEHLNRIEDCVKNATNLTRQLLGFARGGEIRNQTNPDE